MSFTSVWRGLLDLVAPRRCAACDEPLDPEARAFCEACVILLDPGERVGAGMSGYVYGGPMAEAVRRLKYGRRTELAPVLGALLAARAIELSGEVDAVVPVPLHRARLRRRGFNQALELARPLARGLHIPLAAGMCERVRDTPQQSELPASRRAANVRNAFRMRGELAAKHVAIVDDVVTTGATVNELAHLLKRNGAESVQVWAVARTPVNAGKTQAKRKRQ